MPVPTQPGVPMSQPNHVTSVNTSNDDNDGSTSDVARGESVLRIISTVSFVMDNV